MLLKPAFATVTPLVVLTALMLGGCEAQKEDAPQKAPLVGIVTLQPENFVLTTDLPGRTAAYRVAEVRPQVEGIILKRLFKEGTDVKEGDQLYQIDPSTYEANLKQARATLASSQALAARYSVLVKTQAVSKQDADNAMAAKLEAEAAVERAQINVRYTKVLAPITGRIGRSAVTEGALVTTGQATPMATIQQLDPIYVDVTQSSRDMLRLRRELASGQLQRVGENSAKVKLILEDGSEYSQEGTLEFSEVSVDETTGSVTLRAIFPNPDHLLLPGMFVHARLTEGMRAGAILAPQQGITRNLKGLPTALVVNSESKVEQRVVSTNRAAGSRWLIDGGLTAGDKLITEGLQFVRPGVPVETRPATNVDGKSGEGDSAKEQSGQAAQGK